MKGERYAKRYINEEDISRNVREMILMAKHERVKKGRIDFDKLKMSSHALERAIECFGCSESEAFGKIIPLLKRAKRIGEQLAFDGRINVLYANRQYAIYLSPNLETVITVHKFQNVSYNKIQERLPELMEMYEGEELRKELVRLHKEALHILSVKEYRILKNVLEIEKEVGKQKRKLHSLSQGYCPRHYRKHIRQRLDEETNRLVQEGRKLFNVKLEKRHVGKSFTAVL